MFDRVLESSRVLLSDGLTPAAIGILDGRIAAIGPPGTLAGRETLAVEERAILPGLVDTHVHFNDPGRADWEGFDHGSAAAAAGGVTTIVDMPLNSTPVTTNLAALRAKAAAAAAGCRVDYGMWGGLIPGNASQLPALIDGGALGIKCFLCPSGLEEFPAATVEDLEAAAPLLADRGVPLLVHAEAPDVLARAAARAELSVAPHSFARWRASRPSAAEEAAVDLLVDLSQRTGCRIHVVHVSAAGSVERLARARSAGIPVSGETCPHYLTLCAEEIPDGDPRFKCAPPIRGRSHADALWQGLRDGHLEIVVSDHSPCPLAMRDPEGGRLDRAWGGIAGVQLGLPLLWTASRDRGLSLVEIAHWMSTMPARLAGLPGKGALAVGADADLVVFDPEARGRVRGAALLQRHPATPYEDMELRGRVETTFVRGRCVYDRGATVGTPSGRPVREMP